MNYYNLVIANLTRQIVKIVINNLGPVKVWTAKIRCLPSQWWTAHTKMWKRRRHEKVRDFTLFLSLLEILDCSGLEKYYSSGYYCTFAYIISVYWTDWNTVRKNNLLEEYSYTVIFIIYYSELKFISRNSVISWAILLSFSETKMYNYKTWALWGGILLMVGLGG